MEESLRQSYTVSALPLPCLSRPQGYQTEPLDPVPAPYQAHLGHPHLIHGAEDPPPWPATH